jgi:hypothetical protein
MRAGSLHRVAAVVGVILLLVAGVLGSQHVREHGGWNFRSGDNDLMTVMLLVLGAVLALSIAVLRPGRRNPAGGRLTAVVWTVAILICLGFTWWVIAVADRWTEDLGVVIHSIEDLERFVAANPESFASYEYRVPTGVFLQSFEFLNANNVELSGFVWQKYGPEVPDSVQRGVVFPEALRGAYRARESWRVEQDGVEEVGWYFSGTFRQNFDYDLYPFDRQDLWLRLWTPEAAAGVLLVPDFAAYRDLTPTTLPGIDAEFVYGGWDPLRSEFTYALLDYNVDFGLGYGFSGAPDPELYFNLEVARDPLGPIFEHVVLDGAIAILLFFLLLLMSQQSDVREQVGLTTFDLIVAAGGLLFAVILDHNAIRNAVESNALIYLEYFPLILEAFIVLVVLSAVLRVRGWRAPYLGYTGDLVPVLAYWPALLGTLLAITLLTFFYAY